MHVSFLQAWQIWWQGHPVQDLILWGHPVLFWGRIGKTAEYFGAFLTIVDVVGPERLEAFGESLKRRSEESDDRHLGTVLRRGSETFSQLRDYAIYLLSLWSARKRTPVFQMKPSRPVRPTLDRDARIAATLMWLLIATAYGFMLYLALNDPFSYTKSDSATGPWWLTFTIGLGLAIIFAALPWIYATVAFAARLLLALPTAIPYYFAVRPALWLLDRDEPELPLKSVGFAAVLFGFPLDILAG